MGVPKFYRWISEHYPQINQMISTLTILPEFDNFYLDMNGIIHACTHPNANILANSLTLREMILSIFRYVDRIVTDIVKPKKILFMAIDGVAPRAKLNQQRARRFRAGQDRTECINQAKQKGLEVDETTLFDSNCITPGTEFMEIVGTSLRWFIRKKMKEDPLWKNLRIVFSGHDVPGEGEHKIMQFIRELRSDPNYEPNQRHCMYGQDADLIMLGLASHEPHFSLLREVVDFGGGKTRGGSNRQIVMRQTKEAQFQLLHLSILREYITLEFGYGCSWVPDQERLYDDFIFLTFLVGNDFLPHLPTLDISEHAFDVLFAAYRDLMQSDPNGYIISNGEISDWDRLEKLFQIIGAQESDILKAREEEVKNFNARRKKKNFSSEEIVSEEDMNDAEESRQQAYEDAILDALCEGDSQVDGFTLVESSKKIATRKQNERSTDSAKLTGEELEATKDYRGRYYYEKFKILAGLEKDQGALTSLMVEYLKGLMWCIAYYIRGCVSWTWYYPYHYGPMLQDMKNLRNLNSRIEFSLGMPFRPYQQLLGCLPPSSIALIPQPYQWLVISEDSPLKKFYPIEFGIDQDGKKNPWEAVVLLDFIDETELIAAEAKHCPEKKLTASEIRRNMFGNILVFMFDPSCIETYSSGISSDVGLHDIYSCQSRVIEEGFDLSPQLHFKSSLVPGTIYPIAGFPSLTVLAVQGFKTEPIKINVFGTESKYKSIIIELKSPSSNSYDLKQINADRLINRFVYVNYPQIHEAKVVAVSNEYQEVRIDENDELEWVDYDEVTKNKWKKDTVDEENKYLNGRGIPGTGGLVVGRINIRLRVLPLQGLSRDPITGGTKKVFGKIEADIPIQQALWSPPVHDDRFEETEEMSIEKLYPVDTVVVAISGALLGCKGKVIGPHGPSSSNQKSQLTKKRVVDVEFTVHKPEPPFGYSIANSVKEEFFSSKDLCKTLQITPSVLGKLVGSIRIDPGRHDIGLNLKRNGQYQLIGYAHRIDLSPDSLEVNSKKSRKVWGNVIESVQIIGSQSNNLSTEEGDAEGDSSYWEYSVRAATLIFDYKAKFPMLFHRLENIPHQSFYTADQLFGNNSENYVNDVMEWMKSQPFFNMPRTPFSTQSLSREAMVAIEKAADVRTSLNYSEDGYTTVRVNNVNLDGIYTNIHRKSSDTSLPYNVLEPRLGDRVTNLTTSGVPFGLKGTVVTIHTTTKFVEVIFDEEFIGGKNLQGNCSQFRGKLCAWSGLLLLSRPDEFKQYKKKLAESKGGYSSNLAPQVTLNSAAAARIINHELSANKHLPMSTGRDGHVKGQFPANNKSTKDDNNKQLKGNVTEIVKNVLQRPVGPVVSVASLPDPALQKNQSYSVVAHKATRSSSAPVIVTPTSPTNDESSAGALSNKINVTSLLKSKLNQPKQTAAIDAEKSAKLLQGIRILRKENIESEAGKSDVIATKPVGLGLNSNNDKSKNNNSNDNGDDLAEFNQELVIDDTMVSNGTGRNVLAEAAGMESSIMSDLSSLLPSMTLSEHSGGLMNTGTISYVIPSNFHATNIRANANNNYLSLTDIISNGSNEVTDIANQIKPNTATNTSPLKNQNSLKLMSLLSKSDKKDVNHEVAVEDPKDNRYVSPTKNNKKFNNNNNNNNHATAKAVDAKSKGFHPTVLKSPVSSGLNTNNKSENSIENKSESNSIRGIDKSNIQAISNSNAQKEQHAVTTDSSDVANKASNNNNNKKNTLANAKKALLAKMNQEKVNSNDQSNVTADVKQEGSNDANDPNKSQQDKNNNDNNGSFASVGVDDSKIGHILKNAKRIQGSSVTVLARAKTESSSSHASHDNNTNIISTVNQSEPPPIQNSTEAKKDHMSSENKAKAFKILSRITAIAPNNNDNTHASNVKQHEGVVDTINNNNNNNESSKQQQLTNLLTNAKKKNQSSNSSHLNENQNLNKPQAQAMGNGDHDKGEEVKVVKGISDILKHAKRVTSNQSEHMVINADVKGVKSSDAANDNSNKYDDSKDNNNSSPRKNKKPTNPLVPSKVIITKVKTF
eukprot:gene8199-11090_t